MAGLRHVLTAEQLRSLLKTRRANKAENLKLEARLKVLEWKQSQAYIQIDTESDSLRKDMHKIQRVKDDVPASPERRKLHGAGEVESVRIDSTSGGRKLGEGEINNGPPIKERSGTIPGDAEPPVVITYHVERRARRDSAKRSEMSGRARHNFRLIEPPNRPGSRRNFLPVSDKVLQRELQQSEKHPLQQEPTILEKRRIRGLSVSGTSDGASPEPEVPNPTSVNSSDLSRKSLSAIDYLRIGPSDRARGTVSSNESQSDLTATSRRDSTETAYSGSNFLEQTLPSDQILDVVENCQMKDAGWFPVKCNVPPAKHPPHKLESHGITPKRPSPSFSASHGIPSQVSDSGRRRVPAFLGTQCEKPTKDNGLQRSTRYRSCSKSCPNLNLAQKDAVKRGSANSGVPLSRGKQGSKPNSKELYGPGSYSCLPIRDPKGINRKKEDDSVHIYDARPSRSLSKGYQKMQVTIGNKQLSVDMPRFAGNTSDSALPRMRAKFLSERFQPRRLARLASPKWYGVLMLLACCSIKVRKVLQKILFIAVSHRQ